MSTDIVLVGEDHETKDQKRKRLAGELRFVTEQFNSKVLELLETGVSLIVHTSNSKLEGKDTLIGNCEITFQTAPKFY